MCLRKKQNVQTSILFLDDVLNLLDEKSINILSRPLYKIDRPQSFSEKHQSINLPILSFYGGKYHSRFDWHNTKPMDGIIDAHRALKKMREIVMRRSLWRNMSLEPGEAITFNNQ